MKELSKLLQGQVDKMVSMGPLFRVNLDKEKLWKLYLQGFEDDPVFRDPESSKHNCNFCRMFISRFGDMVSIDPKSYAESSMFDLDLDLVPEEYRESIRLMAEYIHTCQVGDIFLVKKEDTTLFGDTPGRLGVVSNIKRYNKEEALKYPESGVKENQAFEFNHLNVVVPEKYIVRGAQHSSMVSEEQSKRQVLERGLREISEQTMMDVIELETDGAILNSSNTIKLVVNALALKRELQEVPTESQHNYLWLKSRNLSDTAAKFKNNVIGSLLLDIESGMSLADACKEYNKRVDPVNYMKAKSPVTAKQIQEAEKFVVENGYADSFDFRCAKITDIDVNEILHTNTSGDIKDQAEVPVFKMIKGSAFNKNSGKTANKNSFKNIPEIEVDKFLKDILPGCDSVEAYLEPRLADNFMTLMTTQDKDSKRLFKWSNNFSWTYVNNLTGKSSIQQQVKSQGGTVDAPFRCSIIWNENNDAPHTDLDLHCIENFYEHYRNGKQRRAAEDHIYFGTHKKEEQGDKPSALGGFIDLDVISPGQKVAVENIYYDNICLPKSGEIFKYTFYIHNFNSGSLSGARAEIFIQGQLFEYNIPHDFQGKIDLATVVFDDTDNFKITHGKYLVNSEGSSNEPAFGLDMNRFHQVNLVCLSPNYWGEQVGNKHYFFFLEGAKNPGEIRPIHNEFLSPDLLKHRKVFEILGARVKVESTPEQLSGLGFNATVQDNLIVKVSEKSGKDRVLRIKF